MPFLCMYTLIDLVQTNMQQKNTTPLHVCKSRKMMQSIPTFTSHVTNYATINELCKQITSAPCDTKTKPL